MLHMPDRPAALSRKSYSLKPIEVVAPFDYFVVNRFKQLACCCVKYGNNYGDAGLKHYFEHIFFCFILLLSVKVRGQELEPRLTVYARTTIFNNPIYDSVVLLEFPFSLNRHEFEFYQPDSTDPNLYARIFAQVDLYDSTGLPVDSVNTLFSVRVASREEAARTDYRLFNRLVLFAKPGSYSARITVIDVVSKRKGEFFIGRFVVEPIEKKTVTLGGLCLAYSLRYVGEEPERANDRLVKNGFEVIVNPLSVFSTSDSVIYLYGEVYNLVYPDSIFPLYELSFSAFDENGNLVHSFGVYTLRKPGNSAVITESFDIAGWTVGGYRLQVVVVDLSTSVADTAMISFRIVSPREVQLAMFGASGADPYDTLDLETKVNLVTYLLTPEQKAILDRLNDQGKLNFLDQFWLEHDENPSTKIIENRIELIERYEFCNRRFSTNAEKTNGWATDRGRIYMTYGPWDEIDDRIAPIRGNPYQIWYYRGVREGKIFVFEDWTGSGEYRLVHSNVYGEIYNKEWQDKIDQGLPDLPIDH
jgi:GWxTD domain-containing protein